MLRCQASQCRAHACTRVSIELPAEWETRNTYAVLAVTVTVCREHARELRRRAAAVLDARADFHRLVVAANRELRERLEATEAVCERLRLENGAARQDLEALRAERSQADRDAGVAEGEASSHATGRPGPGAKACR